jgi:hypothetical protein
MPKKIENSLFFHKMAAENQMEFGALKISIKYKYQPISKILFSIIFEFHLQHFM